MAESINISKFKATCLAALAKVKRTGTPVLVVRKGEPIAQILPPPPPEGPARWLGSLQSTGKVVGEIVEPVAHETEWEVLRS